MGGVKEGAAAGEGVSMGGGRRAGTWWASVTKADPFIAIKKYHFHH